MGFPKGTDISVLFSGMNQTIEALKSVTTFIDDLPKENQEKENQEEDEYKKGIEKLKTLNSQSKCWSSNTCSKRQELVLSAKTMVNINDVFTIFG